MVTHCNLFDGRSTIAKKVFFTLYLQLVRLDPAAHNHIYSF